MADTARAQIDVIAGTNGAGKSSVAGAMIRLGGANYFNPDEEAAALVRDEGMDPGQADSYAWRVGVSQLERAIQERKTWVFETTLGGRTITKKLELAARSGAVVRVFFIGLESPELHITRVRERVASGGHDVPESRIRNSYVSSLQNLLRLLPVLTEMVVWDNSAEGNPRNGERPKPRLVLRILDGRIVTALDDADVPMWARPVVQRARDLARK